MANMWYRLMQIMIYLPSSSRIQLLVLVITVSKVLCRKAQSNGVARHFDWSDKNTQIPRFGNEFKEIFIK